MVQTYITLQGLFSEFYSSECLCSCVVTCARWPCSRAGSWSCLAQTPSCFPLGFRSITVLELTDRAAACTERCILTVLLAMSGSVPRSWPHYCYNIILQRRSYLPELVTFHEQLPRSCLTIDKLTCYVWAHDCYIAFNLYILLRVAFCVV